MMNGGMLSYDAIAMGLDKQENDRDSVELKKRQSGGSQSQKPSGNQEQQAAVNPKKYRDTTDIRPEQDIGGSASNNDVDDNTSAPVARAKPKGTTGSKQQRSAVRNDNASKPRAPRIYGETIQLSKFPREVMNFVRKEFPDASRREDALVAYIYIKSGKSFEVSDDIKELAASYSGDRTIQNMEQRMNALERNVSVLSQLVTELHNAVCYLIFDRKGFSNLSPEDPRSIDFFENGVLDVRERLHEASIQQSKEDAIKKGRPIR